MGRETASVRVSKKHYRPAGFANPRPDRVEPLDISVGVPQVEGPSFKPLLANGQVGSVTVTIS